MLILKFLQISCLAMLRALYGANDKCTSQCNMLSRRFYRIINENVLFFLDITFSMNLRYNFQSNISVFYLYLVFVKQISKPIGDVNVTM